MIFLDEAKLEVGFTILYLLLWVDALRVGREARWLLLMTTVYGLVTEVGALASTLTHTFGSWPVMVGPFPYVLMIYWGSILYCAMRLTRFSQWKPLPAALFDGLLVVFLDAGVPLVQARGWIQYKIGSGYLWYAVPVYEFLGYAAIAASFSYWVHRFGLIARPSFRYLVAILLAIFTVPLSLIGLLGWPVVLGAFTLWTGVVLWTIGREGMPLLSPGWTWWALVACFGVITAAFLHDINWKWLGVVTAASVSVAVLSMAGLFSRTQVPDRAPVRLAVGGRTE